MQPILPLGSILVNIPLGFYNIDSVNPSILRRDLERMSDVTVTIFYYNFFRIIQKKLQSGEANYTPPLKVGARPRSDPMETEKVIFHLLPMQSSLN